jgi:hypothetical protein
MYQSPTTASKSGGGAPGGSASNVIVVPFALGDDAAAAVPEADVVATGSTLEEAGGLGFVDAEGGVETFDVGRSHATTARSVMVTKTLIARFSFE